MRCISGLESSPPQVLWGLTVLAGAYPPLKRFINGFCHWPINFDRLEGRQLWLNSCYCELAHKDDLLQISQDHYQRPGLCWGHHQRGSEALPPSGLNCHRPKVALHLKVLVITMLFFWHQAEVIHSFPPADRGPN